MITEEFCLKSDNWFLNLMKFVLYFADSIKQLILAVYRCKDAPF